MHREKHVANEDFLSRTRNGEVTVFEDLDFLRDDLDADIFGMWNTDDMFSLDHEGINEGSGGFL